MNSGSLLWHVGRDKLFLKSTDLRGGFIRRVRGVLCTHLIHAETFKLKAVTFQTLQKLVFAKQYEGFQHAPWCDKPGVKRTLKAKNARESTHTVKLHICLETAINFFLPRTHIVRYSKSRHSNHCSDS